MKPATRARRRSWIRLAPALLLGACGLALTAGCHTLPEPPGFHVEVLHQGTLEEVQPIDIVVLPIIDDSGTGEVPKKELRDAFYTTLPRRRYSPLSLEYVDRRVVEASYNPGMLQEDAALKVMVREWDLSRWTSHARLTVVVEAWMESLEGEKLWGGRLSKTLNLKQERERHETSYQAFQLACHLIAEELLEVMPARSPQP